MASQGSGTVIDSAGTIITNKHVIDQTAGCWVGFITNYSDEPYFNQNQIADITRVSENDDVAVLKIRNPNNNSLPFVNISGGTSSNLALGTRITAYGYPAAFGTNLTYTSGDFSGVAGGYLKTTAIIEHGNSGGGAYLKDGTFIGIPTAVIKGELNALGYILSINYINAFLNNTTVAYNPSTNNNYARVRAVLENSSVKKLKSLQLAVPTKKPAAPPVKHATTTKSKNAAVEQTPDKVTPAPQAQEQVEKQKQAATDQPVSNYASYQVTEEKTGSTTETSWFGRLVNWLLTFFKK